MRCEEQSVGQTLWFVRCILDSVSLLQTIASTSVFLLSSHWPLGSYILKVQGHSEAPFLNTTLWNKLLAHSQPYKTLQKTLEAIALMPPAHCLVALEMLQQEFTISSSRVPFTKEKMTWSPCSFKNKAYRPYTQISVDAKQI